MSDDPQKKSGRATIEGEFDEYVPLFVRAWLKKPPLMPNEQRADFISIFRSHEITHAGRAVTDADYRKVWQATVLTMELLRLDRLKVAIMRIQERPAVETMLQKTHDGAALQGAEAAAGLKVACHLDAKKYYTDTNFQEKSARNFQAAGFGPDAVEAETFLRCLPSLAVIEKMGGAKNANA